MSKSYTIDELISGYYEKEFSEVTEVPLPRFSLKHQIRMNRIFKLYAKNKEQILKNDDSASYHADLVHHKPLSIRKRIMIAAIIILLLSFMTGFVIMFTSNGFKCVVYYDNTQLFPIDRTDCPQRIEEVYYLSELPSDFELLEEIINDISVYTAYISSEGKTITFQQWIKTAFEPHYNTEYFPLEEISVGNHLGIGLEGKGDYLIAWDNGDYILEIWADLSKSETINLAKSTKVLKNNKKSCP